MATRVIAGKTVQVNDEGFMTNPAEWTKEIGVGDRQGRRHRRADARALEGDRLLPRTSPSLSGKSPTLRQITTGTGVSTKELFALFPKGPAKKVAHIAGLGKPEGCV